MKKREEKPVQKTGKGKSGKPQATKPTTSSKGKSGKPSATIAAATKTLSKRQRKKDNSKLLGRTFQTRDEFLEDGIGYEKPGYQDKGFYRKIVVVDSHEGKLAIVKLTKNSPRGKSLVDEKVSKFRDKPYVLIKDNEGRYIQKGEHFIPNSKKKNLTKRDVTIIKKAAFAGNSQRVKENRNQVREIKGRSKK